MTARSVNESAEFQRVMEALAADPLGWSGPAGDDFVALMGSVLARMVAGREHKGRRVSLLVDPADAVAEAVLVVDGSDRLSMPQNVRRILAMERPLGYVVGAVDQNLVRAELSGRMGTDSRQWSRGSARILHFDELGGSLEGDPLERLTARPAWPAGLGEGSREARTAVSTFVAVLAQRFHVRPEQSRRGLEIAGSSVLEGDMGAGMTPATTRRRLGRFMKELPALRGTFDRSQAQAFAWLLFGTERHPEWSLLAECARAARNGDAVNVSPWQARHARAVASRPGQIRRETGRQPALFPPPAASRPRRMTA